jgi:predicted  nucleic acid-binding Zn-ribbon protein
MQAIKVKADEIYAVMDKKADVVRVLQLSINELNQTVTETKIEFDKTVKSVKAGQHEVQ